MLLGKRVLRDDGPEATCEGREGGQAAQLRASSLVRVYFSVFAVPTVCLASWSVAHTAKNLMKYCHSAPGASKSQPPQSHFPPARALGTFPGAKHWLPLLAWVSDWLRLFGARKLHLV